jgi:hypothetical protein
MPEGFGHVFWAEHPTSVGAPRGHQNRAGEGTILSFGTDEFAHPCAVVETTDGRFVTIRLAVLSREPPEKASNEGLSSVFQDESQPRRFIESMKNQLTSEGGDK